MACGIASAVMLLTGTVHPPGGASAVLAATDPVVRSLGWYFVGLVVWGATLMVLVALVINNIQRQFPSYWWTPLDLRKPKMEDEEMLRDAAMTMEMKEHIREEKIQITGAEVLLPDDLSISEEEMKVLKFLRERLRRREMGRLSSDGKASLSE